VQLGRATMLKSLISKPTSLARGKYSRHICN